MSTKPPEVREDDDGEVTEPNPYTGSRTDAQDDDSEPTS
jgi:hypothetical protein